MRRAGIILISSYLMMLVAANRGYAEQPSRAAGGWRTAERDLNALNEQYNATAAKLKVALAKAVRESGNDRRFLSPLHRAILAVDTWRVFESDEQLLQIIEYEVDVASIPIGMSVLGEDLYPSVHALISLRVGVPAVADAVCQASDSTRRQLLVYLLVARRGSVEDAKLVMERAQKSSPNNQNITKAIEILATGKVELSPPSTTLAPSR